MNFDFSAEEFVELFASIDRAAAERFKKDKTENIANYSVNEIKNRARLALYIASDAKEKLF